LTADDARKTNSGLEIIPFTKIEEINYGSQSGEATSALQLLYKKEIKNRMYEKGGSAWRSTQ
ncbi:4-amino-4-deoxychorismate lyase, partial [Bacillus subtilis]